MLKGIYSAASGMSAGLRRTDLIANNLSNTATPGFKREFLAAGAFMGLDLHRLGGDGLTMSAFSPGRFIGGIATGTISAEAGLDTTGGMIETTNNDWDVAIDGPGFFAVQHGDMVTYSRRGDFRLDAGGWLITGDNGLVLGVGGPIQSPLRGSLVIGEDGQVSIVDGSETVQLGQLLLVEFADASRLARGPVGTLVPTAQSGEPVVSANSYVRQGYLEKSNAHPVVEMAEMIAAFRTYEANQKAVQALDQALGKAVSEVGRAV